MAKVLRGSQDMTTLTSVAVNIGDTVNTANAFIIVRTRKTGNDGAEHWGVSGRFTTEGSAISSITLERDAIGTGTIVEWQVVEHADITAQHGSIAVGDSDTSVNETITSVDTGIAFPIISVHGNVTSTGSSNQYFCAAKLTSATNLNVARGASGIGNPLTVYYTVVEWTGVTVEHETLTITGAVTSATAAISSTTLADAALFGSFSMTGSNVGGQARWKFDSTTQISATREATTDTTIVEAYVVRFDSSAITQRFSLADVGNPTNQAITAVADTALTFTLMSNSTSGTGARWDRALVTAKLTSTTNVELRVTDTGLTVATELQVIELPAEAGGGAEVPIAATLTAAPTITTTITNSTAVASALSAAPTISGALNVAVPVIASLTAAPTITADIATQTALSASLTASATVSTDLTSATAVAAGLVAVPVLSADINVEGQAAEVSIAASLTAVGVLSADVLVSTALAAGLVAVPTISADVANESPVTATLLAAPTLDAQIAAQVPVSAVLLAVLTLSADIVVVEETPALPTYGIVSTTGYVTSTTAVASGAPATSVVSYQTATTSTDGSQ